jgi:Fusaric acid resistance protein-like
MDTATKGALATGALLAGFTALDAPAKVRAAWQAVVAPLVGITAAVGVLTGVSPALAIPTMAVIGAAAGYCFAVSLRLAIAGLSVALSLVISQGLPLEAGDALPAMALATAGGLLQPIFSMLVWAAGDRAEEGGAEAWSTRAAIASLRSNLTLRSASARHALRFGSALAAGVAAYWVLGMEEHGFWIPLTVLFVLRPSEDETHHRLILRAIGTAAGLVFASLLSEWLHGDAILLALALTAATGFSYGLLTVQYALFTAAITTYAVLLADTLGEPALEAAGQRAGATVVGIAIAFLAFLLWSNPRDKVIDSVA